MRQVAAFVNLPAVGYIESSGATMVVCSSSAGLQDAVVNRRSLMAAGVAATLGALVAVQHPTHAHALSMRRILAKAGPEVVLPSGVVYRDVTVGKGNTPEVGDQCAIHYSIYYNDLEVESSRESQGLAARPLGFTYGAATGAGSLIPGMMLGIEGMQVGGVRLMTVPSELAFGSSGRKPLIPPNATVQFVVQLLSVKRAGRNPNVSTSGSSLF